jgi:type IV pilus assembly protein PilC
MVSTKQLMHVKKKHSEVRKTFSVTELLNKDIKLFGSRLNDKNKGAFFTELYILISSSIDIKSAIELIVEGQKKITDQQFYLGIKENIVGGKTLSVALESTKAFSPYEINSIRIGEETGRLDFILEEIASYYSKKIKQRRQVVQALTYPVLVLTVAVLAIFFMMKFIVPMFADVFKRFGGDLPAITKFTLAASYIIGNAFMYFLIVTFVLVVLIYQNKNKTFCRKLLSRILLKIPYVSDILLKIYFIKLCQTMSLLLSSKIPLLNVIKLVQGMIGFYPIEISLNHIAENIIKGEPLHKTIAKHTIYPKRFISLIKVGEETNQLDKMFGRIAEQYNEEVEHRISIISSVLEPAMIIFLGLIVGFILIAMYLPLFQLSATIK